MNKLMMVASAAFAVVAGAAFADGPALPTDRPDGAIDAVSGENGLSWSGAADAWKVGDDTIIVFTDTANAGAFKVDPGKTATARVLAVGGGGPGGYTGSAGMSGGGGGAGGMLEEPARAFVSGSYTIAVGKGGVPVQDRAFLNNNGEDSTISKGDNVLVRAYGGGGGGNSHSGSTHDARAAEYDDQKVLIRRLYDEALQDSACGRCGGSGGGGACFRSAYWGNGAWGGTNVVGQGSFGGDVRGINQNAEFYRQGGGGGGAGGPGGSCPDEGVSGGGVGGEGRSSDITGIDVVYAGGGAGGAYSEWNKSTVTGGNGGGGSSLSDTYAANVLKADDGVDTLGGGGAGAACHGTGNPSIAASNAGKGGSGVVVIRVTKVEDADYVAQIGEAYYKTLADAFADVKGQTTITLLTDAAEDIVFAPQTYEGALDDSLPFVSIALGGFDLGGSVIFTNASLGVSGGTVSAKVSISSADDGSVEKQIPAALFPGDARFVGAAQVNLARAATFKDGNGWSFDVDGDAITVGAGSSAAFYSGKVSAGGSAVLIAGGAVEIFGGQFINNPEAGVALISGDVEGHLTIDGGVFSEEVSAADIGEKEWASFVDKDGNSRHCLKEPVEGANYTVINTATGEATDYVFSDWSAAMEVIGEGGTAEAFKVVQFRKITLSKDNVGLNSWGNPTYRMIDSNAPQHVRLEFDDCDFEFPLAKDNGELLNAPFGFHLGAKVVDGLGLSFTQCRFSSVPYLTSGSGSLSAVDGVFDSCTFAADNVFGKATSKNWGDLKVTNCTFKSGLLPFVPVVNVWKNSQGEPRQFSFVGNTVIFTNMSQIVSRYFVIPEMGTSAAFSFGGCAFKVVDGEKTLDLNSVVIVRKGADPVVRSPAEMYTPDPTDEVVEFSVKLDLAEVEILKAGETVLSAFGVKGLNGLWTSVDERELAATAWPEDDLFTDVDCTQTYDKTAPIAQDLTLYIKSFEPPTDWPDPADIDENAPASEVLGVGGPLQNASLKALSAWAKGWGGVDFANRADIIPDAFLLNCPNSPEAVEEAKAEFKIVSITFKDGVWEVKANEEGTYGKAVVKSFSDVGCTTEAEDGNFFRAYLVVDEVVK